MSPPLDFRSESRRLRTALTDSFMEVAVKRKSGTLVFDVIYAYCIVGMSRGEGMEEIHDVAERLYESLNAKLTPVEIEEFEEIVEGMRARMALEKISLSKHGPN